MRHPTRRLGRNPHGAERGRTLTGAERRGGRDRGQSLVELAIAMPFLLLLMLGTIDLGRMFFDYIDMRNAAREGAGYGAHYPTDTTGISQRVTNHGVPSGTSVSVSCSGDCTTVNGVGTITVTTTHTFRPIATGFLQTFFGIGPITLSADASMRVMT